MLPDGVSFAPFPLQKHLCNWLTLAAESLHYLQLKFKINFHMQLELLQLLHTLFIFKGQICSRNEEKE